MNSAGMLLTDLHYRKQPPDFLLNPSAGRYTRLHSILKGILLAI